jgi:hypothetical protein
MICLFVPAPWVNHVEGRLQSGFYPGLAANLLNSGSTRYLDPFDAFADAHLAATVEAEQHGSPLTSSPLFNGRIGDGHFSAQGCELWAKSVGQRLFDLIEQRELAVVDSRAVEPAN